MNDSRQPALAERAGLVLAGAAAAQVAVSFVNFGLPAIGPDLRREFDLSLPALGALLSASLLGAGLALVPAGALVDRVGTRAAVLAGTALGTAALLAALATHSAVALGAALLVAGVGSAAVPVGGAGAIFRVYGPARRGWALGVRQTAVPLGGIAGAAALPLLVHAGGIDLVLGVAAALVGGTGLWFAVVAPPEATVRHRGFAVVAVWRTPGMRRLLLVAACYIVVLQALLIYLVPSSRAAGLSPFAAAAAYVTLNVTAAVARIVWGRIADRGGGTRRVRTLVDAGVVAAGGALLFALALHAGPAAVLAATAAFGFGALGWNGILYLNAGELTTPELAAQAFAVAATVVFVLSAVSAPPLGALADAAGWDALWLTTAAIALAGALVARGLAPAPAERRD